MKLNCDKTANETTSNYDFVFHKEKKIDNIIFYEHFCICFDNKTEHNKMSTYKGWFVTKVEWFIRQDVRQDFQIVFAKFFDFLRFVHTNSLCFHFLAALEPLNMRQPYQEITLQGVVGIQRKRDSEREREVEKKLSM